MDRCLTHLFPRHLFDFFQAVGLFMFSASLSPIDKSLTEFCLMFGGLPPIGSASIQNARVMRDESIGEKSAVR
jgi:hypothetical protein